MAGVVFLITIGILLDKQPMYIKGPTNPAASATACYGGAAIYAGIWVLSVVYWTIDAMRHKVAHMHDEKPMDIKTYGGKSYGAVSSSSAGGAR